MAKAFKGRWRISEMDVWDNDYLDLVEPAHIVFESENDGAFVFGTVKGWLDVYRTYQRNHADRSGDSCLRLDLRRFLRSLWSRRCPARPNWQRRVCEGLWRSLGMVWGPAGGDTKRTLRCA